MDIKNESLMLNIPNTHSNYLFSKLLRLFEKYSNNSNDLSREDFKDFVRVTESDYLQDIYRKDALKTYIKPNIHELKDVEGNVISKYSYLPLRSICEKYLKNKSILIHLHEEQQSKSKKNSAYSSILDGEFDDRIKGKLKFDDD